jgi:hypothetical protein
MPNDFTITKVDTTGHEKWDLNYVVDAAGAKSKYLVT